jgi:hypothetical protein
MIVNIRVEVASFISTLLEVSGIGEDRGKGKVPKDKVCWNVILGVRLRAA